MNKTINKLCGCGCGETMEIAWNSQKQFKDFKHREAWRRNQPKRKLKMVHQKTCGVKMRTRIGDFAGHFIPSNKRLNRNG